LIPEYLNLFPVVLGQAQSCHITSMNMVKHK